MKKVIFLLVLLTLVLTLAIPAVSASGIKIELDGLDVPTSVDAPPRLIDGRTLVPLRTLAEALGGVVGYEEASRTALISHQHLTIKFPLDKRVMYINEQAISLDVGAQALNGRSYIPARYLAQALGATVSWHEATKTVGVHTSPLKRELVACYAYESATQFQSYGQHINRAMVRWAYLQLQGERVALKPVVPLGYKVLGEEWAPARGVKLSLQVFSEDITVLTPLLEGERANRESLAQEIVNYTRELGFTGINLDLEGIMGPNYEQGLTEFVTILSGYAREHGLHTSAYVPPKRSESDYPAYNYESLSSQLDQLIVMAHDLVRPTDPPGPSAPVAWVEQVLRFALQQGKVPKEKLVLSTSLHGLNWPKDSIGRALEQPISMFTTDWLLERGLDAIPYDEDQGMGYVEYKSPTDGLRILWTETVESINTKLTLVERYNIAGVSFWRLGAASEDLFAPGGPFARIKTP